MTSREHHTHQILSHIDSNRDVSQRLLSRDLGIALGLTNLLVRNLVRKGWVRATHIKPNRVRYLLTPTGMAEKARMSRDALHNSVRFYAETRDRIRERLAELSAESPPAQATGSDGKRVVFFGAGEVAEIAYICLQGTDLTLVGVVDNHKPDQPFFGMPICPTTHLDANGLNGNHYDRLIVMSFADTGKLQMELDALAIPSHRVFWI